MTFAAIAWPPEELSSVWQRPRNSRDIYDFRTSAWYVTASTSPKDLVILVDDSSSMSGRSASLARATTEAILNTVSENDFVNVFRFSDTVEEVVPCSKDTLLQVLYLNSNKGCSLKGWCFRPTLRILEDWMMVWKICRRMVPRISPRLLSLVLNFYTKYEAWSQSVMWYNWQHLCDFSITEPGWVANVIKLLCWLAMDLRQVLEKYSRHITGLIDQCESLRI